MVVASKADRIAVASKVDSKAMETVAVTQEVATSRGPRDKMGPHKVALAVNNRVLAETAQAWVVAGPNVISHAPSSLET